MHVLRSGKNRHWALVVYTVHLETCWVAIMGIDTPHDGASTGIYIQVGPNDTSNKYIQARTNDTRKLNTSREPIDRVVREHLTSSWQLS